MDFENGINSHRTIWVSELKILGTTENMAKDLARFLIFIYVAQEI
jgi:hypothetical protein